MQTEVLCYEADGLAMESHLLYVDERKSGQRLGILVFPEALGLGDHAKSRAERLAGLGYVALACDLHGNGTVYRSLEAVMGLTGALIEGPLRARARAQGGLDALLACPEVDPNRVAAIGYCFGGTMALELARSGSPVAGSVGFHSNLATALPEDAKNIRGKVLVCIGADDPTVNAAQRAAFEEEMRRGGVEPPRDCRRPFGLSYAAMETSSSMA